MIPGKAMPLVTMLLVSTTICLGEPKTSVDGYRGHWFELHVKFPSGPKYSGGLGTYTAKHRPVAVYSPHVHKTYFTYGGVKKDFDRQLHTMVGAFDHRTKSFSQPYIVHSKHPAFSDPHENAAINIDEKGYLWLFVSGRGIMRPGSIWRSDLPYAIDSFTAIDSEKLGMTYPQAWVVGSDILLLFTNYRRVQRDTDVKQFREIYWQAIRDGKAFEKPQPLVVGGHYQISAQHQHIVGTAFNSHVDGRVDTRTNLYYLYTDDLGKTWRTIEGKTIAPPLSDFPDVGLIIDYRQQQQLVYLKDIRFDDAGNPVILYITSPGPAPRPYSSDRMWRLAKFDGDNWRHSVIGKAKHNYDMGTLDVSQQEWVFVGPTEAGPNPVGAGGEVAVWKSLDQGMTWRLDQQITGDSARSHTYVRRPWNAHKDFAWFWADGSTTERSISRLHYTDRATSRVWTMPATVSMPETSIDYHYAPSAWPRHILE